MGIAHDGMASMPGLSTLASVAGQDVDSDDEEVLERGTSLGRYLVLERLGAGAMGIVYAAYDQELDRKIAIKLLRVRDGKGDEAVRQERLIREAKAIAKLSHPNVVGIFDVGVHEGRVFLAMEYLGGGTLRAWVAAKKRPWREIVRMFIEVGQGLAAAHAEGLIHRDFKPDNVLLDKQGKPKVVDFGLVRLTGATLDVPTGSDEGPPAPIDGAEPIAATGLAGLTRTGATNGTPAYMAPEQFLGKATDARTDQFAFCVALYEALYGERPFAGETVMALAGHVATGRMRDTPKDTEIPTWLRRALIRGLRVDRGDRFSSIGALVDLLEKDPAGRLRRQVVVTGAVLLIVAGMVAIQQRAERRRREVDRQVGDHLANVGQLLRAGRHHLADHATHSRAALAAFDSQRLDDGERLWELARGAASDAGAAYATAADRAESAFSLSRSDQTQTLLAGTVEELLLAAEQLRIPSLIGDARKRVERLDAMKDRPLLLRPLGVLDLTVSSPDAKISLEKYLRSPDGTMIPSVVPSFEQGAGTTTLEAGSYRVTLSFDGQQVRYPFTLGRSESLHVSIRLRPSPIPDGMVLVPAGRFMFGDDDEELRQGFLKTTPLHEASTGSFLIGRSEVTYREWIAFLKETHHERDGRLWPSVSEQRGSSLGGSVRLKRDKFDRWALELTPSTVKYEAREGQPIRYLDRKVRSAQDWLSMPVSGISARDAREYLRWLDQTGRVKGARLCSEREWERAARGADARIYPHGDVLKPADANHDATYGRLAAAFGPDEVCSYERSVSPFDACDMAGNILELTTSSLRDDELIIKGGGYYFFRVCERATNRETFLPAARSVHIGFRVCADANSLVDVSWRAEAGPSAESKLTSNGAKE